MSDTLFNVAFIKSVLFSFVVVVVVRDLKDPKVRKENLDLLVRRETKAGLEDLDYKDHRVHR